MPRPLSRAQERGWRTGSLKPQVWAKLRSPTDEKISPRIRLYGNFFFFNKLNSSPYCFENTNKQYKNYTISDRKVREKEPHRPEATV